MSIRCLFGFHDWEYYGPGEPKFGMINRAATIAAQRLWFGVVSHQSEIYNHLREQEQSEQRLNVTGCADNIYNKVCLRCGKKENKIENYNRYLDHRAIVIGLLIRNREERRELAKLMAKEN